MTALEKIRRSQLRQQDLRERRASPFIEMPRRSGKACGDRNVDRDIEIFELASPGQELSVYFTNRWTRAPTMPGPWSTGREGEL